MNYNLTDLNSDNVKTKYAMQKEILLLSQTNPEMLYNDFSFFTQLMNSDNNFMSWTGILVLGNLTKADKNRKIDEVLPTLINKLNIGKMITASNTIKSLVTIAKYRPDLANDIALAILNAKDYKYDTIECHNIIIGHILTNIALIWTELTSDIQSKFLTLAEKEIYNTRAATSKKAVSFLHKYNKKKDIV